MLLLKPDSKSASKEHFTPNQLCALACWPIMYPYKRSCNQKKLFTFVFASCCHKDKYEWQQQHGNRAIPDSPGFTQAGSSNGHELDEGLRGGSDRAPAWMRSEISQLGLCSKACGNYFPNLHSSFIRAVLKSRI